MKINDRLGEIVGGMFRIQTKDETEFELKPIEKNKRELLFNFKETQELANMFNKAIEMNKGLLPKDFIDEHQKKSREILEQQNNIVKEIIKISYPMFDNNQIDSITNKYSEELILELYFAYGWIDKSAFEEIMKQQSNTEKK